MLQRGAATGSSNSSSSSTCLSGSSSNSSALSRPLLRVHSAVLPPAAAPSEHQLLTADTQRTSPRRRLHHRDAATSVERLAAQRILCRSSHLEAAHTVSSGAANAEQRVRIAVDVDEVLGQFVLALNEFCESRYGMKHHVSDYWVYEFAKIWGCDQAHSNTIVHEFFKSPQFKGIPVLPGAQQALARLSQSCDLLVVTSRQHVIQDETLRWLDQHYPGTFKDVYFGNHWSLEGVSRKKSEICRTIGAGLLVDDNPLYAWDCSQAGVHVLLFDWELGYPWSKLKDAQRHPLIRVVRDWHGVEEALQELEPELRAKMAATTTTPAAAAAAALAADQRK